MQTHLVRLDKPYNIICSPYGTLALHIGTLTVVNEKKDDAQAPTGIEAATPTGIEATSYPVVIEDGYPDGQTWTHCSLYDCHAVCREGAVIGLSTLWHLMEFTYSSNPFLQMLIPLQFTLAIERHGSTGTPISTISTISILEMC